MDEISLSTEEPQSDLVLPWEKARKLRAPNATAGNKRPKGRKLSVKPLYVILGALAALAIILAANGNRPKLFAVTIDGETVGYTEDESLATEILNRILEEESFKVGAEVMPCVRLDCVKTKWEKGMDLIDPDDLGEILKERIDFVAPGYVICVEGEEVVALCSEEDARGVLADLRTDYVNSVVAAGHATVDEVLVKEQIDIVKQDIPTSLFRSRREAGTILARGTDKMLNYVVRRGDSLWAIAQANHMTVDELRQANPKVQGDLLQIGENLNLIVPDPYITLSSVETVTYTVSIPFSVEVSKDPDLWPWQEKVTQAGKSGEKEIVEQITRENGQEVSRKKLSEVILSYPVTQKIIRGSKEVPAMGSGELAWPVQGTITSKFGWRWGAFHRGVDIGAPTGTSVKAADAGMVTFAGWNGGYGNLVKIDHGKGKQTWYAHLSRFGVSVGDKVSQGDVVGYVGSTGISTGPHLHFEVHVDGVALDPLTFYD